MLKRIAHIVFSVVMSLLLVFGGVSKEYLHLFTGHTDTVHNAAHDDAGLYFDHEHHHCAFLSFTLPHYVQDAAVYVLTADKPAYFIFDSEQVTPLIPRDIPVSRLRGPPAVLV